MWKQESASYSTPQPQPESQVSNTERHVWRVIAFLVFFAGMIMATRALVNAVPFTDEWWVYILGIWMMWLAVVVTIDAGKYEPEKPEKPEMPDAR